MSRQVRLTAIAFLACALVASAAAARGGSSPPFKVKSTLAGKKVLPLRAHWLGYPSLPESKVTEVAFLIDRKLRWIEHHKPYTYGGLDGDNYLVTSWLKPGRHIFTVRATATDGRKASTTTIARVLPAPSPPPALANTHWKRTLTKDQLGPSTPAGDWSLRIDEKGWKIGDPRGDTNFIDVAYLGPHLLQSRGGIWTKPHGVGHVGGNGWCEDTNVPVDYGWSVAADVLTMTLVGPDRCGDPGDSQSQVWAGSWTRVG